MIIGNHLTFWPAGATLATGVVSITNKPVAETDDDAGFVLPCVDSAELTQTSQDKKVFCPNPGARVLTATLTTEYEAAWKFTLKELDPVLLRWIFGAQDLEEASPITPFAIPRREGWFRVEQYDQQNAHLFTHDFYGSGKVDGNVTFGNDVVTTSLMVDVYMAAANTIIEA